MNARLLQILVICFFIQACNNTAGDSTPKTVKINPNAAPLKVVSRQPQASTGMAVDGVISITFDQPVNMATINADTFSLSGVNGAFEYDADNHTVNFKPDRLNYTSDYMLRLSRDILSSDGGPLEAEYRWDCQTARNNRFAYIANRGSNTLTTYALLADGDLRPIRYQAGFTQPTSAVTDPLGRHLYVGEAGDIAGETGKIHGFNIDPVSGELSPVPGSPFAVGVRPFITAMHPNGKFLYIPNSTSSTISAFTIQNDGALKPIATYATGTQYPSIVAIAPNGRSLYASDFSGGVLSAYRIDRENGQLEVIGNYDVLNPADTAAQTLGLAVSPDSRFVYVSNFGLNSISIFAVDESSLSLRLTAASPVSTGVSPYELLFHPNGEYLYVALYGEAKIAAFQADKATGGLQAAANSHYPVPPYPATLRMDPLGRYVYTGHLSGQTIAAFALNADGGLNVLKPVSAQHRPFNIAFAAGIGPVQFSAAHAYVVNASGVIEKFDLEPDGGFGHHEPLSTVGNARWSMADPEGRRLFVANDNSMDIFAVSNGGVLEALPGTPLTISTPSNGLHVESSSRFVYFGGVAIGELFAYRFDTAQSKFIPQANSPYAIGATTSGPLVTSLPINGRFLYAANVSDGMVFARAVNAATGEPSDAGLAVAQAIPGLMRLFTESRGRFIYGLIDGTPQSLLLMTISENVLIPGTAMSLPAGTTVNDVVSEAQGEFLFVALDSASADQNAHIASYRIDSDDGSLAAIDSDAGGTGPVQLSLHPNNKNLYVANKNGGTVTIYELAEDGGLNFKENVTDLSAPVAVVLPRVISVKE